MKNLVKKIKGTALYNQDGKLNGKVVSSLVALIIVGLQYAFSAFGVTTPIHWDSITGGINTVLVILGIYGLLDDPTNVDVDSKQAELTDFVNEIFKGVVKKPVPTEPASQAQITPSQASTGSVASSQSSVAPSSASTEELTKASSVAVSEAAKFLNSQTSSSADSTGSTGSTAK